MAKFSKYVDDAEKARVEVDSLFSSTEGSSMRQAEHEENAVVSESDFKEINSHDQEPKAKDATVGPVKTVIEPFAT